MPAYWDEVRATGLAVPTDRPLGDLTAELTTMLGDPDPEVRDAIAYPTLATWIGRGVYDDLLVGLGDGMASGLTVGLGERGTDTVFRRSFSALVLGECIARDTRHGLVPATTILDWGDRIVTWLLRERDLRGYVADKGWAHAVAHGADALAALAGSTHVGAAELTVVLDVVADRVLAHADTLLVHGEPDRLAMTTIAVLRRGLVPMSVVEPWVNRIGTVAATPARAGDPFLLTGDAEAFLRALYLQLALVPDPPALRSDLMLTLLDALRRSNRGYLTGPG
jgi:hypothetical protein